MGAFQANAFQNNAFQISGGGASTIYLSGVKVATFTVTDYVIEHEIPAREGGIVERLGSKQFRIKMQGFMDPGDSTKSAILSQLSTVQQLTIPSVVSGDSVFSGLVYVDEFHTGPVAGYGYPFYAYVLNMTMTPPPPAPPPQPTNFGGNIYLSPSVLYAQPDMNAYLSPSVMNMGFPGGGMWVTVS